MISRPLAALLVALPLTAASEPAPVPAPLTSCDQARIADQREPLRMRKLGEMPPGRQQLAVLQAFDRCNLPKIVRGLPLPQR